ncbi:transglutaminase family protein [Mycetocola spongiae]|uniref:transglutaminase family protein n=1 Tax=Mycetocola spongiae TaxID=2859226 RepID=UPI001CF47B12|nr:transglutaminase domain-containing protein [Mycetocola spongiae]UCR89969.1 DUF3488 and transglutaminase-like domain-containing protein [Mycetocola spongiae]
MAPRDAISLAALLLAAAAPLWGIYRDIHLGYVVLGAVLIPGGLALAWARRGWSVLSGLAPAFLAGLFAGFLLAVPDFWGGGPIAPLRVFADGATSGWKQLLTVQPPLGTFQGLLVPPFILIYAASFLAFTLLARRRAVGWSLLPALGIWTVSVLWGTRIAPEAAWSGTLLMLCALGWALWHSLPGKTARGARRAPGQGRRVIAAVVLLGISAAVGGSVAARGNLLPERAVLREAVGIPFDPRGEVSPLVGYRRWVEAPQASAELLTVTGLPAGERLRLAVLDHYDGQVFRIGDTTTNEEYAGFQRIPVSVPGVQEGRERVRIRLARAQGVWLPLPEGVSRVEFRGEHAAEYQREFFFSPRLAAGAVRTGPGAGLDYTALGASRPLAEDTRIDTLHPGPDRVSTSASVPEDLLAAARSRSAPTETAGGALLAATRWLREGYISHGGPGEPASLPGHSVARLNRLATATPMLGDAEQYAAALTVIAAELGFPARVVLGYAPTGEQVFGADLTAWTEVQDRGGEWVGIDPVPEVRPIPEIHKDPEVVQPRPETVIPPRPLDPEDNQAQRRNEDQNKPPAEDPAWLQILRAVLAILLPLATVLALLTAPLWGSLLGGELRRRMRRRADLRDLTPAGAWNEVRDEILDRGVRVPAAATRREVIAAWVEREEPTAEDRALARALTDRIDRHVFALAGAAAETAAPGRGEPPAGPSPGGADPDITEIWAALPALRAALARGDTRAARLLRILRARSLRLWLRDGLRRARPALRTLVARIRAARQARALARATPGGQHPTPKGPRP